MRKFALLALILAGSLSLLTTEASAVVCAKGVYRAGCVGPNGAIVGHRGYYGGGAYYRGGAYARGYRSGTVIRHSSGPYRSRTVIRRH